MGAKSDHFYLFSAYFGGFSPVLLMEYRIFISIVDISANFKNIGIYIDIDKEILENIDIDIDIEKEIFLNIDIDKISNRLEFGISNRAKVLCEKGDSGSDQREFSGIFFNFTFALEVFKFSLSLLKMSKRKIILLFISRNR